MRLFLPTLVTGIFAFGAASAGPLTLSPDSYPPAPASAFAPPSAEAAQVRPVAAQGGYGGGFLEMLFRGPASQQPAYEQRPPVYYRQQPAEPETEAYFGAQPGHPAMDPRYLKQEVDYDGKETPGTIIINTRERMLYLVQSSGRAMRYGIGVGRPGFTWAGVHHVTNKREWPDWTPPDEMLKRRPDLPRHMAGGPDNPLGARAMYLGSTLYRIHGSNEPWTIGTQVSSGCIRMRNEDVIDLYGRVKVGTKVVVI